METTNTDHSLRNDMGWINVEYADTAPGFFRPWKEMFIILESLNQ